MTTETASTQEVAYGVIETVSPLVRRIVARNPSVFTASGTGTYIVGRGQVAVIDPGPTLSDHIKAILNALRGETITHVLATHTHIDHSPAASAIKEAAGATTYGYGPHSAPNTNWGEGGDRSFIPDQRLADGDVVRGNDWSLRAVHTPGHTANHLCYVLEQENILFPGDHVMGWSTTVISPPDGCMSEYMQSLTKLLEREDSLYFPTHGPSIQDPQRRVRELIAHRQQRHAQILQALKDQPRTIGEMVDEIYVGLDSRLRVAAIHSAFAHLVEMVESGEASAQGPLSTEARYRRMTS